jgi:hypothetical protein
MKLKNVKRLYRVSFVVENKKEDASPFCWVTNSWSGYSSGILAASLEEAAALAAENIDKLIELAEIPEDKVALRIGQISEEHPTVLC